MENQVKPLWSRTALKFMLKKCSLQPCQCLWGMLVMLWSHKTKLWRTVSKGIGATLWALAMSSLPQTSFNFGPPPSGLCGCACLCGCETETVRILGESGWSEYINCKRDMLLHSLTHIHCSPCLKRSVNLAHDSNNMLLVPDRPHQNF